LADAQRGENLGEGRPERALRFAWLHIRPASRLERRPLVSGREPIQEECSRIKTNIGDLLRPGENGSWPEVRARLNRLLAGCRRISAMARACQRIGPSITMFMTASGTSSLDGTRSPGAAPDVSPMRKCSGTSACNVYTACKLDRREPCGEISRKAGCLNRARPV
jgi:hypothetical protein